MSELEYLHDWGGRCQSEMEHQAKIAMEARTQRDEARQLLRHVWSHMHGVNLDGTRRPWPGDEGCAINWNRLSDAVGTYLDAKGEHSAARYALERNGSPHSYYWPLFNHMSAEHGLTLLDSECADILRIAAAMLAEKTVNESGSESTTCEQS